MGNKNITASLNTLKNKNKVNMKTIGKTQSSYCSKMCQKCNKQCFLTVKKNWAAH